MNNCFICGGKLKRKNHYLCKDCFDKTTTFYNNLLDDYFDLEPIVLKSINVMPETEQEKMCYLSAMWFLLREYKEDEFLNLLFKNDIILANGVQSKNELIKKNKEIKELNNAIKELSTQDIVTNKKYKNRNYECDDGHVVKSNAELRIDQFLYRNNILHAYEKQITLKDGSSIHPDFYIPEIDVYIEYHGVKGSSWYNKMNKYKDNIFKLEQITVIVISHEQEEKIEKILPVLLNQYGLNKTFK